MKASLALHRWVLAGLCACGLILTGFFIGKEAGRETGPRTGTYEDPATNERRFQRVLVLTGRHQGEEGWLQAGDFHYIGSGRNEITGPNRGGFLLPGPDRSLCPRYWLQPGDEIELLPETAWGRIGDEKKEK